MKSEVGWDCHNMSYVLGASPSKPLGLRVIESNWDDVGRKATLLCDLRQLMSGPRKRWQDVTTFAR